MFSANPHCYSSFVVQVIKSLSVQQKTGKRSKFVPDFSLSPTAVEDEASVRVDGGLRAAQEDPRRREGLRPQGGGGQGEKWHCTLHWHVHS